MQSTEEVLLGLGMMIALVTIVFIIMKYTYHIKKAMIDSGLANDPPSNTIRYLDLGCIVLGLGIGLMVSSGFTTMNLLEDTMDLLIWGTILIFGSIGLLVAHYIKRKLGD